LNLNTAKSTSLLTLKEASAMLGVNPATLRQWDKAGKLKAIKIISRGDRRYNRADIENFIKQESEKPDHPQKKGAKLEIYLEELMRACLKEWGFRIIKLRTQSAGGSQFGKDNISIWEGQVEGKKVKFYWALESKSYGHPSRQGVVPSIELKNKLADIQSLGAEIPDCWCVFAPYAIVDNEFDMLAGLANAHQDYKFKILLWTKDNQIDGLIACFPEIYKKIYGTDPEITPQQREDNLGYWRKAVVENTLESKIVQENSTTDSSAGSSSQTSLKAAKDQESRIVGQADQNSIYQITSAVSHFSVAALESQKIGINEDIDQALSLLDKHQIDAAKPLFFQILGKIEGKTGFNHELARIYNNLGVILTEENNIDKAIEYYRKASEAEANFNVALSNLASAYLKKSEISPSDESAKELDKAESIIVPLWESVKNDPKPPFIQVYMYFLKRKFGLQKLLEFIEEFTNKTPSEFFENHPRLSFAIATHFLEARKPERALYYAETALSKEKVPETLVLKGQILMAIAMDKDTNRTSSIYDDIAPKFHDNTRIDQAIKTFDEAMELAVQEQDISYYSTIFHMQQISRIWGGADLDKVTVPDKLENNELSPAADFIKSVKAFRNRNFETSFDLLRSLPDFPNLPYEEIRRLGRVFLYNGSPEIARKLFDRIEDQSNQRKDVDYWLDCSVVAVLLNEKNRAITAANTAKSLAEGSDRQIALSHFGAVVLRYAPEEGGDRLLDNALEYEAEFPKLQILERFNTVKDKAKISKIIQDRKEWAENIVEIFKNNPIPAYFLEKSFKRPFISVWAGRGPEAPIEYSIVTDEFYRELATNYDQAKVVVMDYISLLTLSKLDLLSDLSKIFPKIQIPFRLFLKIQDELMQEENPSLRKLWDFLRKNTTIEIVKDIPKRKFPGEKVGEVFDPWLLDCLKLAKDKNRALITDDFRLFRLIKSESIKPLNTWIVLQKAREMKLIDSKMYSRDIGKLAECFYTFTSFTGDDLYEIAAEDQFELRARTYHLINQIFLSGANYKSFSSVFAKFIYNLWKSGATSESKVFWFDYLSTTLGKIAETYINKPTEQQTVILETGEDFGLMWNAAIRTGTKDDLTALRDKFPEILSQSIFSKVKVTLSDFLDKRLKELASDG
jgi:excisionase family DNA binding protein